MAELLEQFCRNAEIVGAKTLLASTPAMAVDYIVNLCLQKEPCPKPGSKLSDRIVAMPAVPMSLADATMAALLTQVCSQKNILCLDSGLEQYLTGFDLGVVWAEAGLAASGTCLVASDNLDVRLSTMLCEISVLILPKHSLKPDLTTLAPILREWQQKTAYTALITGPSRTADIERVLAIGVHGPLELHIIITDF